MNAETSAEKPRRIINSVAPIRIGDLGGWTDTWFAEYGAVLNIAVCPFVQAQVFVYPRAARPQRVWESPSTK